MVRAASRGRARTAVVNRGTEHSRGDRRHTPPVSPFTFIATSSIPRHPLLDSQYLVLTNHATHMRYVPLIMTSPCLAPLLTTTPQFHSARRQRCAARLQYTSIPLPLLAASSRRGPILLPISARRRLPLHCILDSASCWRRALHHRLVGVHSAMAQLETNMDCRTHILLCGRS